ncbi:MAG: hypothetical protein BGO67_00505 [Alphaproteobacteria bacterium 41-28]|nr:MAG: hypothetical protein BGO67_00505 [Alphaproteobacteria bacterium 41-28]
MLKVIEPHAHDFHRATLDSFLGLLKIYQNFFLSPEEKDRATYIIANDDKRGVYGGAVLYFQPISSSFDLVASDTQEDVLGKMFSTFQPRGEEYWRARICFCVGQSASPSTLEAVKLCQNFYRNLYKAFAKFGEKKKVEYLTFTLRTADTRIENNLSIITYKNWPCLLEVRPTENSDAFFHGILSLRKKKFKIRNNARSPIDYNPSTKENPYFQKKVAFEGGMGW